MPVQWLIRDVLDAESLAEIFGDAGTGKTFLALDLGLSIASRQEWHGHKIAQNGLVFYIAGEGHHSLPVRIKAWAQAYHVDLTSIPFAASDRSAQILDDSTAEIEANIEEMYAEAGQYPTLIILDTVARNFGCGDENSTQHMGIFVALLDRLKARYHCGILLIHHNGLTNKERARGAGTLRAALDFEYRLEKAEDSETTVKMTCTKCKDHAAPVPMSLCSEIVTIDEWRDPDTGQPITSIVLREVIPAPVAADPSPQRQVRGNQGGKIYGKDW
jgi:RecA-family ATPase